MTWQSVGTHTFVPTDKAVEVGSFDLAAGQDTIWVRITQLNDPADWPFSYGILSWRNANGTPLGSVKAYSNRFGEVFRLGNGLAPSDGVGSIWFEPRGFNLGWIKAGFPWELSFECQGGASGMSSSYWNRDPVNDLLTPRTADDTVRADVLQSGRFQNLFSDGTVLVDFTTSGQNIFYRPTNSAQASVVAAQSDVYGTGFGIFEVAANGQISARKTAINAICERRLKENIVPLDRRIAWDTIKTTPYYSFNYLGADTADVSYGPMIDEVPPEMRLPTGEQDEKGMIHMFDNCLLQARLYTAVQFALERIEKLEADLASK